MAQAGTPPKANLSKQRSGSLITMRMPQVSHMKELYNNVKFRQYRIVRK